MAIMITSPRRSSHSLDEETEAFPKKTFLEVTGTEAQRWGLDPGVFASEAFALKHCVVPLP